MGRDGCGGGTRFNDVVGGAVGAGAAVVVGDPSAGVGVVAPGTRLRSAAYGCVVPPLRRLISRACRRHAPAVSRVAAKSMLARPAAPRRDSSTPTAVPWRASSAV